jgi:geranylgeranyl pyrophosphate synthase
MDIYTHTYAFLMTIPPIAQWPAMQSILDRATQHRPHDWQLPLYACLAVGGTWQQAMPAVAAIAALQASIILIDDLLDYDPRGEYHTLGEPAVANLAAALQAVGLAALARSPAPVAAQTAAIHSLNQMVLTTALGQHWDVQNPADEEAYWRMVQTKSSPFFAAALEAGAWLGGASPETAAALHHFGCLYGEIIQIHDDLNDTMATPANPDWMLGRLPLPILFAQAVDHPDRPRFLALRQTITDPTALAEAQTILIRSGAISYCVDQLLYRCRQAEEHLAHIPLPHPQHLNQLLPPLLHPVAALFAEMSLPLPSPAAIFA